MIDFLNTVISALATVLNGLLSLLPQSPFNFDMSAAAPYLQFFDYIVPVTAILSLLTAYVAAVVIWYMYRWILRIIKFIK